jgi:hypothetical protein
MGFKKAGCGKKGTDLFLTERITSAGMRAPNRVFALFFDRMLITQYGFTEARRAFALRNFSQAKMSCSIPFLLEGSPISACNTSRHRLKRDGNMCRNADLVFLLFHGGENNRSRTTTQDVAIRFMQIVTY